MLFHKCPSLHSGCGLTRPAAWSTAPVSVAL